MNIKYETDNRLILWIIFFSYSTITALLFQKLVLPLIPSMHAGSGLLYGDAEYFHQVASILADKISQNGWTEWSLFPAAGATANVALLSVLYVIFGKDPSLIVPVNAAVHATSGLLMYLLATEIWKGKLGVYTGVIAAILFVAYPSALNWYGQIHKDGYSSLGLLLILYGLIRGLNAKTHKDQTLYILTGTALSLLLVGLIRPYLLGIYPVFFIGIALIIIIPEISEKIININKIFITIISLLIVIIGINIARDYSSPYFANWESSEINKTSSNPVCRNWHWQESKVLPRNIDNRIKNISSIRTRLICSNPDAESLVDKERAPNNASSFAFYLPRALQIALLSPFPDFWVKKKSLTRVVSIVETAIWYMLIPGLLFSIIFKSNKNTMAVLFFSLIFLLMYGYAIANVGTLYRVRYPFIMLLMMIGVSGWIMMFQSFGFFRESTIETTKKLRQKNTTTIGNHQATKTDVISGLVRSGIGVSLLTFLGYVGFIGRDILLGRMFGLGNELDTLFSAMLLPMFLVTMLSLPLGTVLVPLFIEKIQNKSLAIFKKYVSGIGFYIMSFFASLCVILVISSPFLSSIIGGNYSEEKIYLLTQYMFWVLPILLFSGILILGNAILNAYNKFSQPATAQIIVPVFAIVMLLILGEKIGVYAVLVGMLAGQIANLVLVWVMVHKHGLTLMPKYVPLQVLNTKEMMPAYFALVVSTIFMAASLPVDLAMASSLKSGSVAALNMGSKITFFITSVISVGISTVTLPYFSRLFIQNKDIEARNNLPKLIMMITQLTMPISLAAYLLSDYIIGALFSISMFSDSDMETVSDVLKYGVIQIPFYSVAILVIRYAISNKRTMMIFVASLIGITTNISLNYFLMKYMGVAGLSLATTMAIMVSSIVLIALTNKMGHFSWRDIISLSLLWMLFMTLVVCIHFESYVGVFVVLLAYIMLITGGHIQARLKYTTSHWQ